MRFGRFFGKKSTGRAGDPTRGDDELPPADPQSIHGPRAVIAAVEMQRGYWTLDPALLSQLDARRVDQLGWEELLRLHHQICVLRVAPGIEGDLTSEKCRQTVRRLLGSDSPYRPRRAAVWQRRSAQPGGEREPDMQGVLLNISLTHLGCLEVYRVDEDDEPTDIDFVSFDELSGVVFGPPNLIRAAKLFYENGETEMVRVPLLYGLTWAIGNDYDQAGKMTRFVSHLDTKDIDPWRELGIGVGQQDLAIDGENGRVFGLASVDEIMFPLDMGDARFDERARARGFDPDDLRSQIGGDKP